MSALTQPCCGSHSGYFNNTNKISISCLLLVLFIQLFICTQRCSSLELPVTHDTPQNDITESHYNKNTYSGHVALRRSTQGDMSVQFLMLLCRYDYCASLRCWYKDPTFLHIPSQKQISVSVFKCFWRFRWIKTKKVWVQNCN